MRLVDEKNRESVYFFVLGLSNIGRDINIFLRSLSITCHKDYILCQVQSMYLRRRIVVKLVSQPDIV